MSARWPPPSAIAKSLAVLVVPGILAVLAGFGMHAGVSAIAKEVDAGSCRDRWSISSQPRVQRPDATYTPYLPYKNKDIQMLAT
jgi:hypothetical protein